MTYRGKSNGCTPSDKILGMDNRSYPDQIELMFDVMLCLPRSAWKCVLAEVDKKIGTAALRKIILHACNEPDTKMLERLKRGVALLDQENKRKGRKKTQKRATAP
jgi:hypothetical protein